MKQVELAPGISSSVLGFGCAPVLGAVGGTDAARAMTTALDCGINHFDLARSYGYGEAEQFVGRFLKGRREEVVIASKFGSGATWKAGFLRPLKPVVRKLKGSGKAAVPAAAAAAPAKSSDPFHERVDLTPEQMRKSLEKSLRALGSDYLDFFFVHEPPSEIERVDDLAGMAAELKDEGKIRAWGLAFDWSSEPLLRSTFSRFDLLQFNASPGVGHYAAARQERAALPNVLFSPLRHAGGSPAASVLSQLWSDFPSSVVLCSMFNPEHIRENAAAAVNA